MELEIIKKLILLTIQGNFVTFQMLYSFLKVDHIKKKKKEKS